MEEDIVKSNAIDMGVLLEASRLGQTELDSERINVARTTGS